MLALNLTPAIVLTALDEIDATGVLGKDIVEYVLEIAANSTQSSVLNRLWTVCLSKLSLNSWPLILHFYYIFHNEYSLNMSSNLITSSFNSLSLKEFMMELKCFDCPWSCILAIFKELLYSLLFPIKDLLLIGQFYSSKHQKSDIVSLLVEALKCSINEVVYRALVLLTELENIAVCESLKAGLKRILSKFKLDSIICVNNDDFDFDIPMDDMEVTDGFRGTDFAQYMELFPARSIVLIFPCNELVLAVQSIALILKHCDDAIDDLLFVIARKEFKNLRAYLSLLSINI